MYVLHGQGDQIMYAPFDALYKIFKEPGSYLVYTWSIGIPVSDPNEVPLTQVSIIWYPDRPPPYDVAVFSYRLGELLYFPPIPDDYLDNVHLMFPQDGRNEWMLAWRNGALTKAEMQAALRTFSILWMS